MQVLGLIPNDGHLSISLPIATRVRYRQVSGNTLLRISDTAIRRLGVNRVEPATEGSKEHRT